VYEPGVIRERVFSNDRAPQAGKKDKYTCEITSHDNTTKANRSISEILLEFHRQGRKAIAKTGVHPPGFKNGKPRPGFEGSQWVNPNPQTR
jgi:hypothetical protein